MDAIPAGDLVFYSILALIAVENLLKVYISLRQIKVYKTCLKVPKELEQFMTEETFHKARLYGLDQKYFYIFKTLFLDLMVVSLEIYFGLIAFLWQQALDLTPLLNWNAKSEILVSCVFIFLINLIALCKRILLKMYQTLVLEQKHGFNRQTARFFSIDQLKSKVANLVIMTSIIAAIVFIVQRCGNSFSWLRIFNGVTLLILLIIYPIFIAPLLNTYTPLSKGPLRNSIETLAAALEFPLTKVYVIDGSKRSLHSNAYYYGLWKRKRIVLFDTLLKNRGKPDDSTLTEEEKGKGCSDEEVTAVICHELGHWKLGHVTKGIIITMIHLLLIFFVYGKCYKYAPIYEAFGFGSNTRPIFVGMIIIYSYVLAPYRALVKFGRTILSRHFEYQADEFAHKLGYSEKLKHALIKLNSENLGFPIDDWVYSSLNRSHPTMLQRLDRLKKLDAEMDAAGNEKKTI